MTRSLIVAVLPILLTMALWQPRGQASTESLGASRVAYAAAADATSDESHVLIQHDLRTQGQLTEAPWPDGVAAATVFGADNRVPVADTSVSGWRTITLLRLYDIQGQYLGHCSGILLGGNVVLTAAHCLYASGEWVASVLVSPGAEASGPPFGTVEAFRTVVPTGWTGGGGQLGDDDPFPLSPYDYGLVFLDGDPFSHLGPFLTLASAPDSYFGYVPTIATAGFPGDKSFGSMWAANSADFLVDESYLFTELDIWFGQSGSPIWSLGQDGIGFVFSVVSGGGPIANFSVRFTPEIVGRFNEACKTNGCAIESEDFGSYELTSGRLCRSSATCASGTEQLVAGQPVRVAFQLSKLAIEPVRADVFWNGTFAFALDWTPPPPPGTGTFYVSDPGMPPPPGPGTLRLDVWVGSVMAGSFQSTVQAAAAPPSTPPPPTPTVRPTPSPSPKFRLVTQQVSRDGAQ